MIMRLSCVNILSKSGSSRAGTSANAATSARSSAAAGISYPPATSGAVCRGAAADSPTREVADAIADFESVRPRLFGIAYRVLGGVSDAEDVVQDVWIRWQGTDRARVRDQVAFLVTTTTRVALNVVTSAHARREVAAGQRAPEAGPATDDPALEAERNEALEVAVLLLLERMSPIERAVFVLREAFDYPFREIGDALGISDANARQLARRARIHLDQQRHAPVDPADRDRLLKAFLEAARSGDITQLKCLLTDDLTAHSNGGRDMGAPGSSAATATRQRLRSVSRGHRPHRDDHGVVNENAAARGRPGHRSPAPVR
ncbi:sigma-70 family RNA polymerase sigma factor [Pseudonocardia aurantiaca]|uniref:Sigma-70 family RNA polymerase sigma factor n=1 Tax=Pseudonocardia aurantiaca TaxID=75290 RepID=A0ABW4FHD3_9PSEU